MKIYEAYVKLPTGYTTKVQIQASNTFEAQQMLMAQYGNCSAVWQKSG